MCIRDRTETERDRETERERQRQTDRDRDIHTDRNGFAIAEATLDVTPNDVFTIQLEVFIQVVTKWMVTSLVLFAH